MYFVDNENEYVVRSSAPQYEEELILNREEAIKYKDVDLIRHIFNEEKGKWEIVNL